MPGENLDLVSEGDSRENKGRGRRFLGIQFACCGIYSRVYANREGTAYEGNCPRCGRRVRVAIGPGGTDARFFTAY